MADQKLNSNINWVKFGTWKFLKLLIINEFMTQKLKTTDAIWRTEIIKINRF